MKIIGITGGIGSGKSTFCGFLAAMGVPVFECDSQVKRLYKEDTEFAKWVAENILEETFSGELSLKRLSYVVFSHPEKLAALEEQVFKRLTPRLEAWIASQNTPAVVIESAILNKVPEIAALCGTIVEVTSEKAMERAAARDGVSIGAINKRAQVQQRFDADIIIRNDGSLEELHEEAKNFYNLYCK
ncbi:MAG: dephospho-CoA kinase [Bacteroidales bacterium]|nr:dephospho-CoA kinase [Bacteroidales bacterium]